MHSKLTTEEKELLIKGLDALDTPSYNKDFRGKARKLRTRLKNPVELGVRETAILRLSNGKAILIEGGGITRDEAHEIIIKLTETWGTDFEKQELRNLAIGIGK